MSSKKEQTETPVENNSIPIPTLQTLSSLTAIDPICPRCNLQPPSPTVIYSSEFSPPKITKSPDKNPV